MSDIEFTDNAVDPNAPTIAGKTKFYTKAGKAFIRTFGSAPEQIGGSSYLKDRVIVTTASPNFQSGTPTNVPGLTYNVPQDGDYVVHALVNINSDQNEGALLYLAVDGVTDTDSEVGVRMQKNDDESLSITYDIDGLTAGQVITVQLDTNGDNMDLNTRRMLIQSWG